MWQLTVPGHCRPVLFTIRFIFTNLKSPLSCSVANIMTQSHRLVSKPGHTFCNVNRSEPSWPKNQLCISSPQRKRNTEFHSDGKCLSWQGFPVNLCGWRVSISYNISEEVEQILLTSILSKREWRQVTQEPTLLVTPSHLVASQICRYRFPLSQAPRVGGYRSLVAREHQWANQELSWGILHYRKGPAFVPSVG